MSKKDRKLLNWFGDFFFRLVKLTKFPAIAAGISLSLFGIYYMYLAKGVPADLRKILGGLSLSTGIAVLATVIFVAPYYTESLFKFLDRQLQNDRIAADEHRKMTRALIRRVARLPETDGDGDEDDVADESSKESHADTPKKGGGKKPKKRKK